MSEAVAKREARLPLGERAVQAEDAHEISARNAARRVGELRRVGDVRAFDAQLEAVTPGERNRPEHRQVEVHATWPDELTEFGVAEAHACRLRPSGRIE